MDAVDHLKGKTKESELFHQAEQFITNSTEDLRTLKMNLNSLSVLQKNIVSQTRNIYEETQALFRNIPDAPYAPTSSMPTPSALYRNLLSLKSSINHAQRINHEEITKMLKLCEHSSEVHALHTNNFRAYLTLQTHKNLPIPEPMIHQLKKLSIEFKQMSPILSKTYNRIKLDHQANKELHLPHFMNFFLTPLYLKHSMKNIYYPKLIKNYIGLKQKINLSLFDDHCEQLAKIFDARCKKICFDSKVSQLTKPSQSFIWSEFHLQEDILKSFFNSYVQIQKDGRNYIHSTGEKTQEHHRLHQEISCMHHELCNLYEQRVQKKFNKFDMFPIPSIPHVNANAFKSALLSNLIHPRLHPNLDYEHFPQNPMMQARLNLLDIMIKSNFLCLMSSANHLAKVSENLLNRHILHTKSIQHSTDQMNTLALRLEKKFPFLIPKRKGPEKEPMLNFTLPLVEL